MTSKINISRAAVRAISLAGLSILAGCFSLARTEPPQRHYVLGGEVLQEPGPQSAGLAGLSVGVRRLRLASYLDPPFLAVRHGPHEVRYSEYNRWGEPLEMGINRTVAGYLLAGAPFRTVDVVPWAARQAYDYVIQLQVERFEGLASEDAAVPEGEIHFLASWEIVRQQDGVVLARGATEHREGGWIVGDYAGLVRSLDAGLSALARDLTASLADLSTRKAASPVGHAAPP